MYANEEDVPLISPVVKKVESNNGRVWKFISISAGLSALGLLLVSLNGGLTPSSDSKILSGKRLQMSKEGTLTYSALSDSEQATLFDEFKVDYNREVSY
jgi:hypothetical protein